jgi:DNA-directed RNA polymerase subunit RPC12/RpoP
MPANKICPACSREIPIDPDRVGGPITCPNCGKPLEVKPQPGEHWQEHLKTIGASLAAIARMVLAAVQKFVADAQKRAQERKQNTANPTPSPQFAPTKAAQNLATPTTAGTGRAKLNKQQRDQILGCGCLTLNTSNSALRRLALFDSASVFTT